MNRPRILLTRSAEGNRTWATILRKLGADPYGLPCLEHRLATEPGLSDRLRDALDGATWLALTSPRGVESVHQLLEDHPLGGGEPIDVPVAAVGPRTAEACRRWLGRCDRVAKPATGRALALGLLDSWPLPRETADEIDTSGNGLAPEGRIVIAAADRGRRDLETVFEHTEVEICRFAVYTTEPANPETANLGLDTLESDDPPSLPPGPPGPDALFFASPSAVEGFSNLADSIPSLARAQRAAPTIAIGPTTAAALDSHHMVCHAIASEPSIEGLWRAFLDLDPDLDPH